MFELGLLFPETLSTSASQAFPTHCSLLSFPAPNSDLLWFSRSVHFCPLPPPQFTSGFLTFITFWIPSACNSLPPPLHLLEPTYPSRYKWLPLLHQVSSPDHSSEEWSASFMIHLCRYSVSWIFCNIPSQLTKCFIYNTRLKVVANIDVLIKHVSYTSHMCSVTFRSLKSPYKTHIHNTHIYTW